jgi:hypothetical protein
MPVREHVKQFLPPSPNLVQCLRKLFYEILALFQKYNGEQLGPVVNQITLGLANFQEVLQQGLYDNAPDLANYYLQHSIPELIPQIYWMWCRAADRVYSTYFTWTE